MVLMLFSENPEATSLNHEGLILLEFRSRVENDPYGAFANWNPNDTDPCLWLGIWCEDGQVQTLDLRGLSLEGKLAPELGKLSHLRSLVLHKNNFSGFIPRDIGQLKLLELLDLRHNNLSGAIPIEIGDMLSLKRLLLCGNSFEDGIPPEIEKLKLLSEAQCDQNHTPALHQKFENCIWQSGLKQLKKVHYFFVPIKGTIQHYFYMLPLLKFGKGYSHNSRGKCSDNLYGSVEQLSAEDLHHVSHMVRRRLLEESRNLLAAPGIGATPEETAPVTLSSGSFPAVVNRYPAASNGSPSVPNGKPSGGSSGMNWKYVSVIPSLAFFLTLFVAVLFICKRQGANSISPWKTGLSGQLQKAFITGVPKLNRAELETASEDFSNVIDTRDDFRVYKGTLSSGVEIAIVSTSIRSSKHWSKRAEAAFRTKIDTFSRINHKNFVNLLGYCAEDEPFLRVMVFEYAPNGTLYEHLHVKGVERLDWNARVRIIMGLSYCLQHMHHELVPPVPHSHLQSKSILLTDDYAAQLAEIGFWRDITAKSKISDTEESEHPDSHAGPNTEGNVYSFGILLLEIISGKVPYNEEQGSLVNWAADYLNDKRRLSYMIDPSLKSFKNNELDVICEVIQQCINPDPRQRPKMREIVSKLREVISVSPDAATPKLSPLWWAELEILSVEAS